MSPDAITLDFETMPIGPRPEHYPPKPVGLAWRDPYGATGYETDRLEMTEILHWSLDCAQRGCRVEFHNGKFDMHVATEHFGVRFQDLPHMIDDTMVMAFLIDPYARTLGLKPLADKWLGWAAEEKDAIVEWVLAHKDELPRFPWMINKQTGKPQNPTKTTAGAWIAWVPEEIVRPYAIGDVERTHGLARVWRPIIEQMGMSAAYAREMAVMPVFMKNEEDGMRCDAQRLAQDLPMYQQAFEYAEQWLRWRLNAQGLNFDADADVANILDREGVFTDWVLTKSKQKSTNKDNMHLNKFHDREVALVLGYRNRLKTAMKMFMEPWYEQAKVTGRIHTDWNQIQGDAGGTKTGRPSTRNPNFLNISKNFEGRPDGYAHPDFLEGLPHLPLVRKYILPEEGHVLLKRDFSGQELHVFGHFEHGDLQAQYLKDPHLDVHHYVGENFNAITGETQWTEDANRTPLKAMNFQGIYGGGVPALAAAIGVDLAKAKELKAFHEKALPGRKILSDTLSMIVMRGQTIRTWGGRLYPRPPFIKRDDSKRLSPADYRLINYLVQGSSADITKTAMLNLTGNVDYNAKFMLQVYDEMNISAPIEHAYEQMMILKSAMESVPLRTQLPTDGEFGWNWGEMKKLKKPEDYEQLKGLTYGQ